VVVSDPHTVLWHDLECGCYTADLTLWRELADAANATGAASAEHSTPGSRGAILDVGAGSGRVALELARAGHSVTALDLDAELLEALRERAAGMPVETVRADACAFELERRDFALCIAPMQTVQLLGGTDGRVQFLRHARAHLRPGALLVCAIATEIEPFDCDAGDLGPTPEIARVDGVSYISRATRVRVGRRVVRIERERAVLAGDPNASRERPAWVRDVIELDQVSVSQLEHEGRDAGLTPAGTRAIPATEEHTASVAVMFGA
jgi:SAM-dependent methyltransferase